MNEAIRHLLELFDALPESDKQSAVVEILRRCAPDSGDLSAPAFDTLADELFRALDAEEAARAADR